MTHTPLEPDLAALIEPRTGPILEAARTPRGYTSDYTGTIRTASERVFVKAVRARLPARARHARQLRTRVTGPARRRPRHRAHHHDRPAGRSPGLARKPLRPLRQRHRRALRRRHTAARRHQPRQPPGKARRGRDNRGLVLADPRRGVHRPRMPRRAAHRSRPHPCPRRRLGSTLHRMARRRPRSRRRVRRRHSQHVPAIRTTRPAALAQGDDRRRHRLGRAPRKDTRGRVGRCQFGTVKSSRRATVKRIRHRGGKADFAPAEAFLTPGTHQYPRERPRQTPGNGPHKQAKHQVRHHTHRGKPARTR
jgi:hypothetical protein